MFEWRSQSLDPRIEQQFGGRAGIELLIEPRAVQAYRLDQSGVRSRQDLASTERSGHEIAGYKVIAGPVDVSEVWREKLVADWLASKNYLFNLSKGCYPHWDAAYRFTRAAEEMIVSFCFTCGHFTVDVNGIRIAREIETYYHSLGSLMVARTLFPEDERLNRSFSTE